MTRFLIGIWIIGTSLCFADGDDFNSASLNTNKWSLTSEYSANFVHTNGYISFKSTNATAPAWGYIYWKEKMSLSNNWNAKIQAYINPGFVPTNSTGNEITFWDGPTDTNGVHLAGIIEAQIGVTDNPNGTNANAYANTLLKGSDNKKYFNPNYDINASHLGLNPDNTDLQFKEIFTDKVLLELGYDASAGLLYSKMFDYSDNTLGVLLFEDFFSVSQWGSVNDVYVFVGGDTYYSEAPQGSATLDNFEIVPEPSALSLLAVGLGGLAMMRRRRS